MLEVLVVSNYVKPILAIVITIMTVVYTFGQLTKDVESNKTNIEKNTECLVEVNNTLALLREQQAATNAGIKILLERLK